MEVDLHRVTCKDCPWFQTFESKVMADEAERIHQAQGHRTERRVNRGRPPRPPSATRVKEILRGMP